MDDDEIIKLLEYARDQKLILVLQVTGRDSLQLVWKLVGCEKIDLASHPHPMKYLKVIRSQARAIPASTSSLNDCLPHILMASNDFH